MDSANFAPQMKRTLTEINDMTANEFTTLLSGVYEHSPWIAAATATLRPFESLGALSTTMREVMDNASEDAQLDLIRAHPDLAGKLAQLGQLTAESIREQAAAGMGAMSPEELQTMTSHNEAYREKFGFPFIICARRHTKDFILTVIAARLQNTPATERATALAEIHQIAQLRIDDLLCLED